MEIYEIEVQVPLGIRKGSMKFETNEEKVIGTMKIFGNETDFDGSRKGNRLYINGNLKTPIRLIPYYGIGYIRENHIHMTLHNVSVNGKENLYELTGIRSSSDCSEERKTIK